MNRRTRHIYYCTDLSIQSNADDVFHNYFTYNTIGCLNYILCSWACVIFAVPISHPFHSIPTSFPEFNGILSAQVLSEPKAHPSTLILL